MHLHHPRRTSSRVPPCARACSRGWGSYPRWRWTCTKTRATGSLERSLFGTSACVRRGPQLTPGMHAGPDRHTPHVRVPPPVDISRTPVCGGKGACQRVLPRHGCPLPPVAVRARYLRPSDAPPTDPLFGTNRPLFGNEQGRRTKSTGSGNAKGTQPTYSRLAG
jgi:hypothetical protein